MPMSQPTKVRASDNQTRKRSHSSRLLSPFHGVLSLQLIKPQMQTPKTTLKRFRRTALLLISLMALLVLVLSGTSCSKSSPMSPIVFGHLAVPTSMNTNFVSVAITNQRDSVVVYLACPSQVKSNGIWSGPPNPPRQRMMMLAARQSGAVIVEAASVNENARVPVLWGFYDYNPRATRWQQRIEDLVGRVSGRGGRGFLYTNYLTDLKP